MLYWLLSHLYLLIGSYQYSVNSPREETQGPIGGQFDEPILSGAFTIMENLEQRIAMIRNDREHGSRWLVRETISILYDIATQPTSSPVENLQQLQRAGKELANARPAMAALAGAVRRILNAPGGLEGTVREAAKLLREFDSAIEFITGYARPLLTGTIM